MQTFDNWLRLVHVMAAIVWVGGAVTITVMSMRLVRTREAATMRNTAVAGEFMGRAIYTPAALIILAAGIWLVARVDFYEFSQAWIIIGFVGIAWGAVTGAGFFGRQLKSLAADVELHGPTGTATEGRISRIVTMSWIDIGVLGVVVWAMVTKPGL